MITPPTGLRHRAAITVDDTLTVPQLPAVLAVMAGMPQVFATAYMIAFVEATCIDALAPFLEQGERTVGTRIDMTHIAATPAGLTVTAEIELVEIDGRKLAFRVCCFDDAECIGEGTHQRAMVIRDRFDERMRAKQAAQKMSLAVG